MREIEQISRGTSSVSLVISARQNKTRQKKSKQKKPDETTYVTMAKWDSSLRSEAKASKRSKPHKLYEPHEPH
jgi:hypothetical protein